MVLVSILGDFHSSVLPIFYQSRNLITKHIVIYDDFKCDEKEALNIIEGIAAFKKKYNLSFEQINYKVDEDSQKSVILAIAFFHKHCKDFKELYVNTTDGLASFNILLASKLLPLGANIMAYDRFDNEYNIITSEGMRNYKVEEIISIQDHFLLKNLEIYSIGDKAFALQHKDVIIELFEKHGEEFKEFAKYIQTQKQPNFAQFQTLEPLIKSLGLITSKEIKSKESFISGGLFEYYIFLKLVHLNFDDIEVGIGINQYYDEDKFIPNEFDILIMKENHLHMIECKYTANVSKESLVYKYMALKHLIDDDGKIIMVTTHDDFMVRLNDKNPMTNLSHKRAKANRMLLFGNPFQYINRFVLEVEEFFELKEITK